MHEIHYHDTSFNETVAKHQKQWPNTRNSGQTPEKKMLEICHHPGTNWGFYCWSLALYLWDILNVGRLVLVLFQGKVPHNSGDR